MRRETQGLPTDCRRQAHRYLGDRVFPTGQAVEASPGHLESRCNLGLLHLIRGEVDQAIDLLEAASRLQPDHELVHGNLGMAYLQRGRNEDAYRSFLLVRRLYPRNWIAPFGLALLHAGSGQPEQARELLDEAVWSKN